MYYLGPHFFHTRIKPQRAAEGFEGRDGVLLKLIRLAHDGGGKEVVGVDLQGPVAVADGGRVLF